MRNFGSGSRANGVTRPDSDNTSKRPRIVDPGAFLLTGGSHHDLNRHSVAESLCDESDTCGLSLRSAWNFRVTHCVLKANGLIRPRDK